MAITVGGNGPDMRAQSTRTGSGSGIVGSTIDHAKAVRQSIRHTRLVRVLRLVFPLLALATVGAFYVTLKRNWNYSLPNGGKIDFSSIGLNGRNLVVSNPRYRGFSKDGGSYSVTAKTGVQDMQKMDRIELHDVSGSMLQANRNEFRLWSKQGLFDNKQNELELWDHIYIEGDNGMKGWLSRAKVYVKDSRIVSDEPVILEALNGTINAERMTVNQKTHKAVFEGNVKVHILRANAGMTAKPTPKAEAPMPAQPQARAPAQAPLPAPQAAVKPKPAPLPQLRPGQTP